VRERSRATRHHGFEKPPTRRGKSRGRWHDLGAILGELNELLFERRFEGRICWGREGNRRRRSRRTIRLGSYSFEERLIRIHPALDQAFVPKYFVEWVVYHEMLHQKVPTPTKNGRRLCHTREFRSLEACFPHHATAKAWEDANLQRLLTF